VRRLWIVESIADLRNMQRSDRAEGDDMPSIGPVMLDTTSMRISVNDNRVGCDFTLTDFIKALASECDLAVEIK